MIHRHLSYTAISTTLTDVTLAALRCLIDALLSSALTK